MLAASIVLAVSYHSILYDLALLDISRSTIESDYAVSHETRVDEMNAFPLMVSTGLNKATQCPRNYLNVLIKQFFPVGQQITVNIREKRMSSHRGFFFYYASNISNIDLH